ncbi:hypothetical protein [Spiroplasma endosymbiont of Tipula paludosa]|uniref:hypothetical protein n=1 Tax=Spiroplasma endosymbiont of Tipula paludosa TaxID=3066295 RepID=UPI0035C93BE2
MLLNKEINDLNDKIAALEGKEPTLEQLKVQLEEKNQEIIALQAKIKELEGNVGTDCQEFKDEIVKLQARIKELEDGNIGTDCKKFEDEIIVLKARIKELEGNVGGDCTKLEEEVKALKTQLEDKSKEILGLQARIKELETGNDVDCQEFKDKIVELEAKIKELEEDNDDIDCKNLEKEILINQEILNKLQKELIGKDNLEVIAEIEELENDIILLEQENCQLFKKIRELKCEPKKNESEIAILTDTIRSNESKIMMQKKRIELLKRKDKTISNLYENLKDKLCDLGNEIQINNELICKSREDNFDSKRCIIKLLEEIMAKDNYNNCNLKGILGSLSNKIETNNCLIDKIGDDSECLRELIDKMGHDLNRKLERHSCLVEKQDACLKKVLQEMMMKRNDYFQVKESLCHLNKNLEVNNDLINKICCDSRVNRRHNQNFNHLRDENLIIEQPNFCKDKVVTCDSRYKQLICNCKFNKKEECRNECLITSKQIECDCFYIKKNKEVINKCKIIKKDCYEDRYHPCEVVCKERECERNNNCSNC